MGNKITIDDSEQTISLSQTAYIEKMLESFGLENINPVSTPMDPNVKLDDFGTITTMDQQGEFDQ